jgi:small subunit ribosomal protein S16
MSVKLRLKRVGMRKQAYYRLVAVERRCAPQGAEIEVLGHYDPKDKDNKVSVNQERVQYWLSCGAQVSDTVKSLLKKNQALLKGTSSSTQTSGSAS